MTTVLPGGVGDGGPAVSALVDAQSVVAEPGGTILFDDFVSAEIRRYDPTSGLVTRVWGNGRRATDLAASRRGNVDATSPSLPGFSHLWLTSSGVLYGVDTDPVSQAGNLFSINPSTHVLHLVQESLVVPGFTLAPLFVRADGTVLYDFLDDVAGTAESVWSVARGHTWSDRTPFVAHPVNMFAEAPDGTLYDAFNGGAGVNRVNPDLTETLVAGTADPHGGGSAADGVPLLGAQRQGAVPGGRQRWASAVRRWRQLFPTAATDCCRWINSGNPRAPDRSGRHSACVRVRGGRGSADGRCHGV